MSIPSAVLAIADNTSPNATYSGVWSPHFGNNWEYGNTTFGSQVIGSTATFVFQGTRVSVFGTQDGVEANGDTQVSTYSVDGSPPMTYTAPATTGNYQQRFFQSPPLEDGNHTLAITVQNHLPVGGLWLDYFLFEPSPQTLPYVDSIIDDADGRMSYTGQWDIKASEAEFNMTTHSTNIPNSTATFQFSGTHVSVYGSLIPPVNGTSPCVSSYALDGAPAKTYTAPVSNNTIYRQMFFDSGGLKDGPHTLTITTVSDQASGKLWLDYILLRATAGKAVTPAPPSSGASVSGPTAASNANSASTTSGPNVGAIAGGVIGGLVLIVFILSALLLRRRQRRKESKENAQPHHGLHDRGFRTGMTPAPIGIAMPYHLATSDASNSMLSPAVVSQGYSKASTSQFPPGMATSPFTSKSTYLMQQHEVSTADYGAGTSFVSYSVPASLPLPSSPPSPISPTSESSSRAIDPGMMRPLPHPPVKAERSSQQRPEGSSEQAPPPYA